MATPLTPARAAILRSNAGRSGYPIPIGAPALMYAVSNLLRSGASRSNYHNGQVFISVDGEPVGPRSAATDPGVLVSSFTLRDALDHTPTTGQLTAIGFTPTIGHRVIITLGSPHNLSREFAGTILRTVQSAITSDPQKARVDCALIDDTWGLNTRKVSEYYTGSASTIAAALVATYAPGYTTAIAPDLPTLSGGVSFTNQDLTDCLTQLCKRIGANWTCDYQKTVRVPADYGVASPPTVLNSVHPSLRDFVHDEDLSQTVTRVHVEGGGVVAGSTVPPGETILPLAGDPTWYDPAGGLVVSGPQRLTYSGVVPAGGGGLVGTGAAPTGSPQLALAPGAGVPLGVHGYAVTFVTPAGESIAGPVASIATEVIPGPIAAPLAGTPTTGSGPDAGSHDYAVTFVTASGETLPGPRVTQATASTLDPTTAPTVGVAVGGNGPDPGLHDYAVTFVTASGETLPGPISGSVSTGLTPPPTTAPGVSQQVCPAFGATLVTDWRPGDSVVYVVTFATPSGETPAGPYHGVTASRCDTADFQNFAPYINLTSLPVSTIAPTKRIYRAVNGANLKRIAEVPADVTSYVDQGYGGVLGVPPTVNTANAHTVPLSAIPIGPAGVTARRLYRRSAGQGLKRVDTIPNNTATTFSDTRNNASLGAAPPTSSTATAQRIPLSAIPKATSPLVTSRRLYGTAANHPDLRLVAALGLTETTYVVTVPDSGLGALAPAAGTAIGGQVQLTGIPVGAPTVTARKLYRTAADVTPLQWLTTIANNTATTYLDAAADAALGAAPPLVDSSGLTQPQGNVLAGSTSLVVASIGAFPPAGWAVIGNGTQVIRYTGISGNVLTGIPPSGPGSIQASIAFNSTVTAAPSLTGIPASGPGAIRYPILKGDDVNLWITVTDLEAQAARAARLGGDGIQEDYLQDRRLARVEATARGQAILALKRDPILTVRYTCRDPNTRAGRTIVVNLGPPYNLYNVPLLIQSVTVSCMATRTRLLPLYSVEASSVRLTFEQLIASIRRDDAQRSN